MSEKEVKAASAAKTKKTTSAKKTTAAKKPAPAKKTAAKKPATKAAEKKSGCKVLFASSEVTPFAASGGLAEVASSLPISLCERGYDVRVILPLYGTIKPEWREKMHYVCNFIVPVAWRSQYCGLFEMQYRGVTYYFLDNEYYFKRDTLYGHYDDGERFAFFSRAILETVCHLDFAPDIIHCNDWQTALVPAYLRFYRSCEKLANTKTLFTIHNIQFQGKYGTECLCELFGLREDDLDLFFWDDCLNLMKGAIELCDKINTVSPTYSKEIMDPWYSFGLDSLLKEKQYKLCGILNGIDNTVYDPANDPNTAAPFSADDASGKAECKKELLKEFGLPDDGRPVAVMITRLTAQKGVDLVSHVMKDILDSGIQFIMLGSGDKQYEEAFSGFAAQYPDSCAAKIAFLPALSKKMYAGADIFLMPSKTEPCGLAQMMALRYGTVPIVRETGGLADSIKDCSCGSGNGFTFKNYNAHEMLDACRRAAEMYRERPEDWAKIREYGMRCDFSWDSAAGSYIGLYDEMVTLW